MPWLALAWVGNAAQGLQPQFQWFRFQTHGVHSVRASCPKLVKLLVSLDLEPWMSGSWMPWPCLHHQPGRLYRPWLGLGQSYRSSCLKASSFQRLVLQLQGLQGLQLQAL